MAAGYRPLPTQLSVSGDDTEERAIQEVYRYESQKKDPQTKVPPDKRSPMIFEWGNLPPRTFVPHTTVTLDKNSLKTL